MIEQLDGFPLVNSSNWRAVPMTHGECGAGYELRDYSSFPLNGQPFNREPTIQRLDEKLIVERIIEKTAKGEWVLDLAERVELLAKMQATSEYCWIHADVHAMELRIVATGAPKRILSAFLPGSQIKHGANVGGSAAQGRIYLNKYGTCTEDKWPPMKFRGEVTEEIKADQAKQKLEIYEEFDPKDLQLIYSAIVADEPVPLGIRPWSHEITACRLGLKGGKQDFSAIRPIFRNSWSPGWGTRGCGALDDEFMDIDEAGRVAEVTLL